MTVAAVLGLAVLDSINPSALLVTIYLLMRRSPGLTIATYLGTILLVYLTIGFLLMFGIDWLWETAAGWLESRTAYLAQGMVGGALLTYAVLAPGPSESDASHSEPRSMHWSAMVLLGVTVTILELPTALPYFAAIGIMTTAELAFAEWAAYLIAYNLIFITPPIVLYISARIARSRIEAHLPGLAGRLQRHARETWLWILGIVGFFLLADALVYFDLFPSLVV